MKYNFPPMSQLSRQKFSSAKCLIVLEMSFIDAQLHLRHDVQRLLYVQLSVHKKHENFAKIDFKNRNLPVNANFGSIDICNS